MKKKILWGVLIGFILVIAVMVVIAFLHIRDRHSGYTLDLQIPAPGERVGPVTLSVGVGKVPITPNLEDTWVDADSNARYEPKHGDTYIDRNGNGRFDAFWLAGFHNNRPAQGIHDPIWARAVVWDDGHTRVALVVLDAIGFFHDDVISVREKVARKNLGIDHVIVSSTHCHEVPDLMGLWGPAFYRTGVNDRYLQYVQDQAVQAIVTAVESMRPAILKLARIDSTAHDLVRDSRPPSVLDDRVRLMLFCDAGNEKPFGILLNWGNHPETLGSENLQITADFCHYWLKGIEEGIEYDGDLKRKGIAGTGVFANGAIGGLMTTLGVKVHDPWLKQDFEKPSFAKARAQGYRLAALVLDQIEKGKWKTVSNPAIRLRAKTFLFPLQNKMFKLGGVLGIFHRGFVKFNHIRSEVDLLSIGPAWILTIPGEINPEIVNGGIEVPEGADFPGEPVEVPPIRRLMKGEFNFVIGLANDEVGYIMPRTHWDTRPPFTYGAKKAFYGEINSLGPDAGPTLYQQVSKLIAEFDHGNR